jgi:hypothetical protein
MRRLLCIVALCATLSACAKTVWQDATGNGRGAPELQMASANCQLYAQANTQQTDTSQCQQGKGQTGCILAGAIGNALAQGMTFNLCMQGQGWQQVKVTQVAQSQQPAFKEVAEADCHQILKDSGETLSGWCEDNDDLNDRANDDSDDDKEKAMTNALFEEGKEAQRSGDYTTALELYRKAARDGDARAGK